MEEILASIRRIIADDQEAMRGAAEEFYTDASPLRNVLDLAERQVVTFPGDESHGFDAQDDGEFPESEMSVVAPVSPFVRIYEPEATAPTRARVDAAVAEPVKAAARREWDAPARPTQPERPAAPVAAPEDRLLSRAADDSVSDSLDRLDASLKPGQPRSLEDVVMDMLRPQLKAWLDENLPAIVERLVQAEIERISRSRR